jgi:tight adherence protein C
VIPLIALFTFAATMMVSLYLFRPRENVVRRRILEGATPNEVAGDRLLQGSPFQRLALPSIRQLGSALGAFLPTNFVREVERQLIMANQPASVGTFLFWWAFVAAIALAAYFLLVTNSNLSATQLLVTGPILIVLVLMVPFSLLRRRARRRRKLIERALPDALDLLVTGVEAGLGVDAAFAMVADRSSGPIAATFGEYLRQIGLGRQRQDALSAVAQRTGVDDLIRLSLAVAQSTEVGTNLGDVLRLQAQELRTRRRLRAQEAGQKAPVWMVIPLALCFLPAMVAVIIVPSMLNFLEFVGGLGE